MLKRLAIGAGVALALALAGGSALAQGESCFYANQWTNWTAPNNQTLFLRVGDRVFRVDMAGPCANLRPGVTLITSTVGGNGQLCRAMDWNLKVRDGGISTGCIVGHQTQLTAAQIAALPSSVRP